MNNNELVSLALKAREFSYSPYSNYKVGAALLCADMSVYTGCNVESVAFSPTICAERAAIVKAVSEGKRDFLKIAVVGGVDKTIADFCTPCGVCRQTLAEFCNPDFEIILVNADGEIKVVTIGDLLPLSFTKLD